MQGGSDKCHLSVEAPLAQAQRAKHVGTHTVVEEKIGALPAGKVRCRASQQRGRQNDTCDFSRKRGGNGGSPRDGCRKNAREQCQKPPPCCIFRRTMRQQIAHGAALKTRSHAAIMASRDGQTNPFRAPVVAYRRYAA